MSRGERAVVVCIWDDYRTKPMPIEQAEKLTAEGFPNCSGPHKVEPVPPTLGKGELW